MTRNPSLGELHPALHRIQGTLQTSSIPFTHRNQLLSARPMASNISDVPTTGEGDTMSLALEERAKQ
jgi:hypothetical protein